MREVSSEPHRLVSAGGAEPGGDGVVGVGMTVKILFVAFGSPAASAVFATSPEAPVALWPGTPPGVSPAVKPGGDPRGRESRANRLTDVAEPTLTCYRPEKPEGRALIVCPGGGYGVLAVDIEGDAVARRFAAEGRTVYVLHYRVPAKDGVASADAAPLSFGYDKGRRGCDGLRARDTGRDHPPFALSIASRLARFSASWSSSVLRTSCFCAFSKSWASLISRKASRSSRMALASAKESL